MRLIRRKIFPVLIALLLILAIPLMSFAEGESKENGIKKAGRAINRELKHAAEATQRSIKKAGRATNKELKKGGDAVNKSISGSKQSSDSQTHK